MAPFFPSPPSPAFAFRSHRHTSLRVGASVCGGVCQRLEGSHECRYSGQVLVPTCLPGGSSPSVRADVPRSCCHAWPGWRLLKHSTSPRPPHAKCAATTRVLHSLPNPASAPNALPLRDPLNPLPNHANTNPTPSPLFSPPHLSSPLPSLFPFTPVVAARGKHALCMWRPLHAHHRL